MNRSIKNIFTSVALTLAFMPAVRCEKPQSKPQQRVSLSSMIDFIIKADVEGFKNAYDAFTQSDITSQECATRLQDLAFAAQEAKAQLQTELETNGDKINKTMLAKGAMQTILGTYAALATMFCLAYKGKYKEPEHDIMFGIPLSFMDTLRNDLVHSIISRPVLIPQAISIAIDEKSEKLAALSNIIITPLTGYLAYNSLNAGIQNCKNGWNYKYYLQQQIANIDEISAFIEAQQKIN